MGSSILFLLPGLPLAGSLAWGLVHLRLLERRARGEEARAPERLLGILATLAVLAPFAITVYLTAQWLGAEPGERTIEATLGSWIPARHVSIAATLRFDPLAAVLLLVVTGVGAAIHAYSIGYLHGDRAFARYFSHLNLFVAAMTLLVLAGNLPLLFVGWEGVGLCSYLLIGFWHEKEGPPAAGLKAFVVNRVGDAGFLLGIFLLAREGLPLDLAALREASGGIAGGIAAAAGLLLLAGAIGKSAQFPLQVWLPDAMAGPTPVSALIHAATMVTAGVYLVVRLDVLFLAAPQVLALVGAIGGATALVAATSALAERDLKRALAYSTISQLGLMFLGAGSGAPAAAIGHLVTHAFFKALLFLAAGSVIHALQGEQDLTRMGGLARRMRGTFLVFLAGAAALAGIPPLAGFFSKDEILAAAFRSEHAIVFGTLGLATSLLTAAYAFRLVLLVFAGEPRMARRDVHESSPLLLVPMGLLAILSLAGGLLVAPIERFLPAAPAAAHEGGMAHGLVVFLATGVAVLGVFAAAKTWRRRGAEREADLARHPAWRVAGAGWFLDVFYQRWIVRPARALAIACGVFDLFVLDGAVHGVAKGSVLAGGTLRRLQDGRVQSYAAGMAVALALLLFAAWSLLRP